MKTSHASLFYPRSRLKMLLLCLAGLLSLYVILPQISSFQNSFNIIKQGDVGYIAIAGLCWLMSYIPATLVYCSLSLRPIRFTRMLIVQMASGFANRITPAGSGALAINYQYLVKIGHKKDQAAALVTLNNMLGFLSSTLIVSGIIVVFHGSIFSLFAGVSLSHYAQLIIGVVVFGVLLVGYLVYRQHPHIISIKRVKHDLAKTMTGRRLLKGFLFSCAITLLYNLALMYTARAFHIQLTLLQLVIVFATTVGFGALSPTPGGLGGAEAGMVLVLARFHVQASTALAIAFIYRLFVFWAALGLGAIFFTVVLRKKYL